MKKFIANFSLGLLIAGTLVSCQKTSVEDQSSNGLSTDDMNLIKAAGFNNNWAEKTAEGNYLIEGDIYLSKSELQRLSGAVGHELVIAKEEHYRTTNVVSTPSTGSRVITVSLGSGFPSYYSNGLDQSLARYNNLNLKITFQRVSSGGDIVITGSNLGTSGGGCILGRSAGFPDAAGNPAPGFTLSTSSCATSYISDANRADEVMAHEIGHAIGFRHTDYMSRISCGQRANEGTAGVGAIWIPGTVKRPSSSNSSWMMACTNGNPTFTSEDGVALQYVY